MAAMAYLTDIPDWVLFEGMEMKIDLNLPFPAENLPELWSKSPIRYVENVCTPIMFQLSAGDLRVPPAQAVDYIRVLKANGKDVRYDT